MFQAQVSLQPHRDVLFYPNRIQFTFKNIAHCYPADTRYWFDVGPVSHILSVLGFVLNWRLLRRRYCQPYLVSFVSQAPPTHEMEMGSINAIILQEFNR